MGFENDIMVAKDMNFDPSSPKPHAGQFSVDGTLPIGSSVAPFVRPGFLTSLDGSVSFTFGNGTIDLSTVANVPWIEVTAATQAMSVNTGYVNNRAGTVTYTLPTSAAYGDMVAIITRPNGGLSLWNITYGAGQYIVLGGSNQTTVTTGSLTAVSQTSQVVLRCIIPSGTAPVFAVTSMADQAYIDGTPSAVSNNLGIATVGQGGTGGSSWTNHGLLVGSGTSALNALAVGATHSVLMGTTGSHPSFTTTGTPYVSSISFDAGANSLATYAVGTWTPTVVGGSTAGTTTYTLQTGNYIKIGRLVFLSFRIDITAATGTGAALFGGLPFAIQNAVNEPFGSFFITVGSAGWAWPAATTQLILNGKSNTSTMKVAAQGTGSNTNFLQMSNNAATFEGSLVYMAAS